MFEVYMESAGGAKKLYTTFNKEADAQIFCEENRWEITDKNGFVWNLDYREV